MLFETECLAAVRLSAPARRPRQDGDVDDEDEEDNDTDDDVCYLVRGVGGLHVEGSVAMPSTLLYFPSKTPKV